MPETVSVENLPRNKIFFGLSLRAIFFGLVLFIATSADAIVSYSAPILIEKSTNSTFLMGVILSTSSLVGLIFDLLMGFIFKNKGFKFFTLGALLFAGIFSSIFLLFPANVSILIVGMAIWGIYYELLALSKYEYIYQELPKKVYANAWSYFTFIGSLAYLIGPLVASFLISYFVKLPFAFSLTLNGVALLAFFYYLAKFEKRHLIYETQHENKPHHKIGISSQFKIVSLLFSRVWPLLIFVMFIVMVDSAFWSVGVLLTEQLKQTTNLAGFLLPAYTLPGLLFAPAAYKVCNHYGKKRTALISGFLGSVLLIAFGLISDVGLLIITVFLSSIFFSTAFVGVFSAFEDYVSRLDDNNTYMVGLSQAADSIAYILGPIAASAIAQYFGIQHAFSVIGIGLASVSLAVMVIIPRKIKMPLAKISDLT